MKKAIILISFICFSYLALGQKRSNTSLYINIFGDVPIYNIDIKNNPFGGGIGVNLFFHTKSKLSPVIDLNYNRFINSNIVYFAPISKTIIEKSISCIFLGGSDSFRGKYNLSLVTGATFYDSHIYLGVKSGFGLHIDNKKKFILAFSLTNIFHTPTPTLRRRTIGFLNLEIRIKLV